MCREFITGGSSPDWDLGENREKKMKIQAIGEINEGLFWRQGVKQFPPPPSKLGLVPPGSFPLAVRIRHSQPSPSICGVWRGLGDRKRHAPRHKSTGFIFPPMGWWKISPWWGTAGAAGQTCPEREMLLCGTSYPSDAAGFCAGLQVIPACSQH